MWQYSYNVIRKYFAHAEPWTFRICKGITFKLDAALNSDCDKLSETAQGSGQNENGQRT